MHVIAHRANLNGPDKSTENLPKQIELCISKNFECEIDVWYINETLFLGHDEPQYEIPLSFLLNLKDKLWCHCKHLESFEYLLSLKVLNCFYHQTDDYVLTSKGWIWVYPGKNVPNKGIVVMPEWSDHKYYQTHIGGICTDYVESHESFLMK